MKWQDSLEQIANCAVGCECLSKQREIVWEQTKGPYGGSIKCLLALSEGTLYAATLGGIFRSKDGGDSWKEVNTGLTNLYVHSLSVLGTTIYAGTGGGLFRALLYK
jgi:photosystem II stability/assembly factor-like uncharacterized protein